MQEGLLNPNSGRYRTCPAQWYVVGAVLGDGYLFRSKQGYLVGLDVRSRAFASKYADKLSIVLGRRVRVSYYSGNGIWFVRVRNLRLFLLIRRLRRSPRALSQMLENGRHRGDTVEFLSGYFDAEVCVKVVREPARRTAKLCLDVTGTSKPMLDQFKRLGYHSLAMDGRYSWQSDPRANRAVVYHLRFYKKRDVGRFIQDVGTIKLTRRKKVLLGRWLALG